MSGASIRGVRRIEASIIGHDVEVTPAPRVPRAHRLVLGDHSKVQISIMKILVTGAAGFIGSHYVRTHAHRRLRRVRGRLGHRARQADLRRQPGQPRAGGRQPQFTFVRGDIGDAALLAEVLPGHDAVVNFAAETHVDRSIAGAAEFVTSNVTGVQVLLDACLAAGVPRVVHVSTDEVYGSHRRGLLDRGLAARSRTRPTRRRRPAATSSRSAYARTHGLNVSITRCCNNYGPYQFPEKVIPLFVTNLLDGKPVPLYGDGLNVRGWIHVDDHCRGIQLVLERGAAGRVYNINGDIELSNRELTQAILEACGASWDMVVPVDRPEGPRPPLLPRRLAPSVDGVRAAGAVQRRAQGDHRVVRGQPGLVGAAAPSRAARASAGRPMTSWLITGAAGMLGTDLVSRLAAADEPVTPFGRAPSTSPTGPRSKRPWPRPAGRRGELRGLDGGR